MRDSVHRGQDRETVRLSLKDMCFQAVRTHFAAVGAQAVLDLPVPLIKDLLPHLTVCQLDELQPPLNQRGISTHAGWVGVMKDIWGPNHAKDFPTEEEAKVEVMRMVFTLVFYGARNSFIKQNITSLNAPSYLWAATKCNRHFELIASSYKALQGLTAEQRPLLDLQEKHITSICVSHCIDLSKRTIQPALYVLHRLLDHGVAKKLIVKSQCPIVLAWLLHGRGSQYINPELKKLMHSKKTKSQAAPAGADEACRRTGLEEDQDDRVTPCKRPKLDSVSAEEEGSGKISHIIDPQVLCQTFTPCDSPSAGACPWGQIESLRIRDCGSECLRVLNSALPTFFCLRSLMLNSCSILRDSDMLGLALALRQLSESSRSSLTDLSISVLPYTELMPILLDASPNVTSLHVEIQSVIWGPRFLAHRPRRAESDMPAELSLEKLTVRVTEIQTDLLFITSVLRHAPRLTTLHVAGLRLPTGSSQSQLLNTLSGSNHLLRSLSLEDMNLSDCLPEILNLLRDCKLEELRFNDCRLLEKWSDKEKSLQQLVAALKTVPSLHTLSLAQNRLAKNVCVLAELFSGCSPSSVKRLDISSNFIQPAELLEFAKKLTTHRPRHQLTLDLRKNPGDRDPDTWNAAIEKLRPFCVLQLEGWTSTNTMADHISNM